MNRLSQAEQFLLDQIRAGDSDAWGQFVQRYQGRLIAFARQRMRSPSDAEDVVQETFLNFVRGMDRFRGEASLETYLFTICRRRMINWSRGKRANLCLLEDVMTSDGDDAGPVTAADELTADDPTASFYARRNEAHHSHQAALTDALTALIDDLKRNLNFRDLKIVEMLFYCRLRNKDIAEIAGVKQNHVAVTKHRCLKEITDAVQRAIDPGQSGTSASETGILPLDDADAMLSETWRSHRLSCLKRSTIGAHLLGTLEPEWDDYVRFHLQRLGCQFCLANLADVQAQTAQDDVQQLHERICQSTVGFLHKP